MSTTMEEKIDYVRQLRRRMRGTVGSAIAQAALDAQKEQSDLIDVTPEQEPTLRVVQALDGLTGEEKLLTLQGALTAIAHANDPGEAGLVAAATIGYEAVELFDDCETLGQMLIVVAGLLMAMRVGIAAIAEKAEAK